MASQEQHLPPVVLNQMMLMIYFLLFVLVYGQINYQEFGEECYSLTTSAQNDPNGRLVQQLQPGLSSTLSPVLIFVIINS